MSRTIRPILRLDESGVRRNVNWVYLDRQLCHEKKERV